MPQEADPFCSRLVQDGDERIALDPLTGLNSYGCGCTPDPALLEFGSATASTISRSGFVAAREMARRMAPWIDQGFSQQAPHRYALTQHIRERLLPCLLGAADDPDAPPPPPSLLLSASGTDALRQGAALCAIPGTRLAIFLLEAEESGRGVPGALAQCPDSQVLHIPVRDAAGHLRPVADVEQALETAVSRARQAGEQILLVLTDVSKTGLIAPSPACVVHLQQRFGSALQVLVDACQLRLTRKSLRAYLARGCLVALTGSKFMGGPSFSGALLVPAGHTLPPEPLGRLLQQNRLAPGPLLRWIAALADMEAFARIPEALTQAFLSHFAGQIIRFIDRQPRMEALPVPVLDRSALFADRSSRCNPLEERHPQSARGLPAATGSPLWDQEQTIFPFLLYRTSRDSRGAVLHVAEMLHLFHQLPGLRGPFPVPGRLAQSAVPAPLRGRLGQPVRCGQRDGEAQSALRLCASARLVLQGIVQQSSKNGENSEGKHSLHRLDAALWPDITQVQSAAQNSAQQACQFLEYVLWESAKL